MLKHRLEKPFGLKLNWIKMGLMVLSQPQTLHTTHHFPVATVPPAVLGLGMELRTSHVPAHLAQDHCLDCKTKSKKLIFKIWKKRWQVMSKNCRPSQKKDKFYLDLLSIIFVQKCIKCIQILKYFDIIHTLWHILEHTWGKFITEMCTLVYSELLLYTLVDTLYKMTKKYNGPWANKNSHLYICISTFIAVFLKIKLHTESTKQTGFIVCAADDAAHICVPNNVATLLKL